MKATKLALVAALAVAISPTAFAQSVPTYSDSGTITINGLVIAKTCTISFTGATQTGNDATVTLPTVYTSAFATSREVASGAGSQAFDMKVENCDPAFTQVSIELTAGGAVNGEGDLVNAVAGGSNVAVRFQDNSVSPATQIDLSAPVTQGPFALAAGAHTFEYAAEYYGPAALGTATAGAVQAVVNYTVTYQ